MLKTLRRPLAIAAALTFCVLAPLVVGAAVVSGQITFEGAPLQGAMVTAHDPKSEISITVFSRADGGYRIDGLSAGNYELGAKLTGKQFTSASLMLGEGDEKRDFSGEPDDDYRQVLSSAAFLSLLPEGDMKREFLLNCASCHEVSQPRIMPGGIARTEAQWAQAITLMRSIDVYGLTPPDFIDAEVAKWLAQHLNAEAIARLTPPPAPSGATLGARITEYPVPLHPSLPHDLVLGPAGRVWVTAFYNNVIWALDPKTSAIQSYPVNEKPSVMGQVRALSFDRDGMLWVLLGGSESLVRLNPSDGSIKTFPVGMYPHSIEVDSSGKLWFNDYISAGERLGSIEPESGELEIFKMPSAGLSEREGLPLLYGLVIDQDDVLWGTMLAANKLFSFDTRSRTSKLYDMPVANSGPRRPGIAPDGSVWIPEFNTGTATRFDPKTETFSRTSLGLSTTGPYDIAVDPTSGHVWSAASLGSAMVRIDPASGARDVYPFPTEPSYPRHIAIDAVTGDVWTTYSSMPDAEPKIVRIEINDPARN